MEITVNWIKWLNCQIHSSIFHSKSRSLKHGRFSHLFGNWIRGFSTFLHFRILSKCKNFGQYCENQAMRLELSSHGKRASWLKWKELVCYPQIAWVDEIELVLCESFRPLLRIFWFDTLFDFILKQATIQLIQVTQNLSTLDKYCSMH